eukprot:6204720-Pleurochrysis_carterae.AAC.1
MFPVCPSTRVCSASSHPPRRSRLRLRRDVDHVAVEVLGELDVHRLVAVENVADRALKVTMVGHQRRTNLQRQRSDISRTVAALQLSHTRTPTRTRAQAGACERRSVISATSYAYDAWV